MLYIQLIYSRSDPPSARPMVLTQHFAAEQPDPDMSKISERKEGNILAVAVARPGREL